jgi:peroxiredoxin (alkyl hydroperoxide reductase subunit C)
MRIGEIVPDLELSVYRHNMIETIKLSQYAGKWVVLFFYPGDFTFVCPTELEELAQFYPQFKKEQAEIISLSTDSVYVHKAWHDTSPGIAKIQFPMAADQNGKIAKLFGVYLEEEGVALRGTFIIDPDRKLVGIEVNDNSVGRSSKELLRKLTAFKFVREHPGNVCPASWTKEKKSLKPGLDLVGKL